MHNKEVLVLTTLQDMLSYSPRNTQCRTHLHILLNQALAFYKNNPQITTNKMSKQDILDKEFAQNLNSPYATNDRVKPKLIKDELERLIYSDDNIIKEFRELGFIPVFKESTGGGRNNPSCYWLEIEEILINHNINTNNNHSICVIHYQHKEKSLVKISWFAKLFFDKNHELQMFSIKGILLIILLMSGFILTLFLIMIFVIFIYFLQEFLTLGLRAIMLYLIVFLLTTWNLFYFYRPLNNIVVHRIVKAPKLFLSLNHNNAEIEFFGKMPDYKYNTARITEIRATCPICTAPILLMHGKPDQTAPLVGRCIEAPHAHVYSFDRMLMKGYFLGHPMYLQQHNNK